MEKEISLSKKYNLPDDIRIIEHLDKFIIIAPKYSNWIVLNDCSEVEFFYLLRNHSIETAIALFDGRESTVNNVILQIEARHLESVQTTSTNYTHMQLYLTNNCNMRCPHCFMYAGKKYENELSTEEILKLLSNFRESGGTRIILTGGEIGLRKDLREIIIKAFTLGIQIELLTNGTLFTDELIKSIANKVSRVQVSIDGYSETSNRIIRGNDNFDKALHTVDKFINAGVRTEIAVTPFPYEQLANEVNNYIDFGRNLLKKYGENIIIKFTTDIMEGRDIDSKKIDKQKYSDLMNKIIEGVYGESDDKSGFIISARQQVLNDNCAYGALNISASGDVFPCAKVHSVEHFANIRTTDWTDIVEMSNKLKDKSNIASLEPCKDCELLYICGGGCRLDYFESFLKPKELLKSEHILPRTECNERKRILDLLIETNEYIFH